MVKNLCDDLKLSSFSTLIDARVYTSRLLGQDTELVMHGGGNTSLKDMRTNLFGEKEEVLYIKGSGCNLDTIEASGFPIIKLAPLIRLRSLKELSDLDMMNYLRSNLCVSPALDPSVETLLHAFLPHKFVDHTHADAVLTLTNQPNAKEILTSLYEGTVSLVPYIMPGFSLALECARIYENNPNVKGLILLNHGVVTFADTAKESYQRMIEIVEKAQRYIETKTRTGTYNHENNKDTASEKDTAIFMQSVRKEFLKRKFPAILLLDNQKASLGFVNREDLSQISQQGPITPDHVIRTKRLPLILTSNDPTEIEKQFNEYKKQYEIYFNSEKKNLSHEIKMLDTLPRVILAPGIGLITAGETAKDAKIAMDIYQHTLSIIEKASAMSSYEALPSCDIFDVEYWVLEQAKLLLRPKKLSLTGKIGIVTGGASGIGKEIAKKFLEQGAILHILDLNEDELRNTITELKSISTTGACYYHTVDLRLRSKVSSVVNKIVQSNGGIDFVVCNAGIFPQSESIEEITPENWNSSLDVNLNGSFHTIAECIPWMKMQANGGDLVLISTKNVHAPGPKAASYSVAKAAAVQLARVCALETGKYGIRVNMLHPNMVFDTGIWSENLIESRAKAYNLTPQQYRTNNLLQTDINSSNVADSALALVNGLFAKTTGAQIPVDGGSDRTL